MSQWKDNEDSNILDDFYSTGILDDEEELETDTNLIVDLYNNGVLGDKKEKIVIVPTEHIDKSLIGLESDDIDKLSHITQFDWLEKSDDEETTREVLVSDTFLSWLDLDKEALEKLDVKDRKKIQSKKFILYAFVFLFMLTSLFIVRTKYQYYNQTVNTYVDSERTALLWLKSFVNKDYVMCDALSTRDTEKLTTVQNDFYEKLLYKISDCIEDISIKKIVDNNDKMCYTVNIRYKTYNKEISPDVEKYHKEAEELTTRYINDELTEEDVKNEVLGIYDEIYNDNFVLTEETQELEVVMYEKKVMKVIQEDTEEIDLSHSLELEETVSGVDSLVSTLILNTGVMEINQSLTDSLRELQVGE